ncbi:hypothetical protein DFY22_15485 [Escherichia coli]|uniref:hypothetical protein n=1 Tax=Escherichia coli TaxID=562 RepID=UPI0010B3B4D1|nr:hypothetical protein [Escherichia coli]EEY4021934.1 hypothetical protein [Escherichia coli]EFC2999021.1 hypothetical protein [Escherichia coli]EFG7707405.1 hypothetical protein [Escherichia coli]EFH7018782.1 hypothetical protein [Escherichia coli]EFJ0041044.1 hypothetical protein [Escherichia coli]
MKKMIELTKKAFIKEDGEDVKIKWKTTIVTSMIFGVIAYNYIAVPVLAANGVILAPIPLEHIVEIITTLI